MHFSSISVAELAFKRSIAKFEVHPQLAESWVHVGIKPLNFDIRTLAVFARFPASQVPGSMDRKIVSSAGANSGILLT